MVVHTVQVHGNDMVCAGACEEVCNERAGLGNPLPVADLRLKGGGLCDGFHGAVCAIGTVKVDRGARVARLGAADAISLDGARGCVGTLLELHATQLGLQRCGSAICSEASALGQAGAGRLGARLEAVGALARAGAGDLCERGARLVVGNVGLARVGEEGQDDGDALGRGRLAGRDGDEESAEESGTGSTHVGDKRAYSIKWSLTGREG
jgi:hypothetical protein